MDAAWKKGAYPGKRVHTLHGLQKKAVRYTQVGGLRTQLVSVIISMV